MWCLLPAAAAATPTDLPPFLRGDAGLAYGYDRLSGSLDEAGAEHWDVGQRAVSTHLLEYRVKFGVAPGVALGLALPQYVRSSVSYGALQEMVYDPATGTGTYYGTDALDPGSYVQGAGFGGVWFELGGRPFAEAYVRRNNLATWYIALAARTPDPTSFWTVSSDGQRGAGPGGAAVRLVNNFSKTIGAAEPYLATDLVFELPTSVTLADQDGTPTSEGEVVVNPADSGGIRVGAEVTAARNTNNGAWVALDVHAAARYAAYGDVPSGVYLPAVLDASVGSVVQQAESLDLGGGVGLIWRPMEYLQVHGWGQLYWHLPQRIESPYPVYTWTDTTRARVGVEVTVRVRTDATPKAAPTPVEENPWG